MTIASYLMILFFFLLGIIIFAYLLGSISSAVITSKMMRLPDPRTQGSGNPGATNVLRIGGKKAAIITLLGDLLKGLIPVLIAQWFECIDVILGLVALAAFLGHLYPIFFRFQGGKGVATFLGCLIGISWPASLLWIATWFLMAIIFRYSSLASLTASLLAPLFLWFFTQSTAFVTIFSLMALLLVYRHQENINKLLAGKESKLGKKK